MKRLERLAAATAPDGTVLTLYRRDGDYAIRVGGVDLMSTRRYHSEERLAELACRLLQHRRGPRVLIGGLGFGFTLRAVLRGTGLSVQVSRVRAHATSGGRHTLLLARASPS